MENSLVDRIRWSRKSYTLRMLLEFRRPPCIVIVTEGYRGNNEVENLPPGLVVRVHSVFGERRVFARCVDGRVFSIPESFPIKFEVVKKKGKKGKAKRLDEILRNYSPPILVTLDRKNNKWNFQNGQIIQSEESLGTLVLFKAYYEHFARVNQLINGVVDRRVFLIPLYLDVDVRLAEGLKSGDNAEYTDLMNMHEGRIDYSTYAGLNAILVFDPSGSIHPLASSRLPSRTNSSPGISEARTDEPTTGEDRGSTTSGSQARSRARSEITPYQNRRTQSEDFLARMNMEHNGKKKKTAKKGAKDSQSMNESAFSGQSSSIKHATPAPLDRKKGRSAEELQERTRTRPEAAKDVVSSSSVDRDRSVEREARGNQSTDESVFATSVLEREREGRYMELAAVDRELPERNEEEIQTAQLTVPDTSTQLLMNAVDRLEIDSHRRTNETKADVHKNTKRRHQHHHYENTTVGTVAVSGGRQKTMVTETTEPQPISLVYQDKSTVDVHSVDQLEPMGQALSNGYINSSSSRNKVKSRPKIPEIQVGQNMEPVPVSSRSNRSKVKDAPSRDVTGNRMMNQPIPKPRSRLQSEDSSLYEPTTRNHERRPDGIAKDESRHHRHQYHQHPQQQQPHQGQTLTPYHEQNIMQGQSPSSPHPNYHIHINVQSPYSPPVQQQQWPTMGSLNVHSSARKEAAMAPITYEAPPPHPPPMISNGYPGTVPLGTVPLGTVPLGSAYFHLGSGTIPTNTLDAGGRTVAPPVTSSRHSRPVRQIYVTEEIQPKQYRSISNKRLTRDPVQTKHRSRNSEGRGIAGHVFVTAVPCLGSDAYDQEQAMNTALNEYHRSNRLRSKVIRLVNADESEISDRDITENYGRYLTLKPTGNYVTTQMETRDVNNNPMAATLTYNRYAYTPATHSTLNGRIIPSSTAFQTFNRSSTNVGIPSTVNPRVSATVSVHSRKHSTGRSGAEATQNRRWILRKSNQPSTSTGGGFRSNFGTTVAVD